MKCKKSSNIWIKTLLNKMEYKNQNKKRENHMYPTTKSTKENMTTTFRDGFSLILNMNENYNLRGHLQVNKMK